MKQAQGFRRRLRWVGFAGCLVLLFALLIAATLRFNRPRWHTYIGPAIEGTHLALAVDYPEDWQPDHSVEPDIFRFVPKSPTGLTKWWYQHVIRRDLQQWNQQNIEIYIEYSRDMYPYIDKFEKKVLDDLGQINLKPSIHRTRHNLGPALDVTVEDSQNKLHNSNTFIRCITVFPAASKEEQKIILDIGCEVAPEQYTYIRPAFEEMVRRVRLVLVGRAANRVTESQKMKRQEGQIR